MGWQERTSAPPLPRRGVRSRRNELTLLAMLVSVVATLVCWQLHVFSFPVSAPHRAAAPTAAVVYGTGLAHNGSFDMTCTAMLSDASGGESCTVWTILGRGQQAVQALQLPTGSTCPAVIADQHTGHWVCTNAVTT